MQHDFKQTSTGEIRFNCPMCLDTKYHLYYNPSKSVYWCHRCHYRGHGFPQLVRASFNLVPQVVQTCRAKSLEWQPLKWPAGSILESVVWDYLLNTRHLQESTVKKFGLGWTRQIPLSAVIPVLQKGEIKFLQVRFLSKNIKPKYLNYSVNDELVEKARFVFNLDQVIQGVDTLFIMEGVFDVMSSAPFSSICTFGKNISAYQLKLIKQIPFKKVVLSFDIDVKIKELMESIKSLETFCSLWIKKLPAGKDPGDLVIEEFEQLPDIDVNTFMLEVLQYGPTKASL